MYFQLSPRPWGTLRNVLSMARSSSSRTLFRSFYWITSNKTPSIRTDVSSLWEFMRTSSLKNVLVPPLKFLLPWTVWLVVIFDRGPCRWDDRRLDSNWFLTNLTEWELFWTDSMIKIVSEINLTLPLCLSSGNCGRVMRPTTRRSQLWLAAKLNIQ